MRTIVLILLACAISTAAFSQGNLQFNQVIFQEYSMTLSGTNTQSQNFTLTVPAGRVLKIESANGGQTYTQGSINYAAYGPNLKLHINGIQIYDGDSMGTAPVLPFNFPIWLPAGTYTVRMEAQFSTTTTTNNSIKTAISGIEFNIVP